MEDAIGYFFIILLILIAAPLIFWIGSLLYAWVKWLFHDKSKLNASFSEMSDITNPVKGEENIRYKIGTNSEVELVLSNKSFKEIKSIFKENKNIGNHTFTFDTKSIDNGVYFLQLKTVNHTITKKIIIEN